MVAVCCLIVTGPNNRCNGFAVSEGPLLPHTVEPVLPVAEKYTYDLVRVNHPSVVVPDTATGNDLVAGYEFVTGHSNQDVPTSGSSSFSTSSNTFYIPSLPDGLYRVRVKSANPNSVNPAVSSWSNIIGTGEFLHCLVS